MIINCIENQKASSKAISVHQKSVFSSSPPPTMGDIGIYFLLALLSGDNMKQHKLFQACNSFDKRYGCIIWLGEICWNQYLGEEIGAEFLQPHGRCSFSNTPCAFLHLQTPVPMSPQEPYGALSGGASLQSATHPECAAEKNAGNKAPSACAHYHKGDVLVGGNLLDHAIKNI